MDSSTARLVHGLTFPPLMVLQAGDETARGVVLEPLIDEIACALREWANVRYLSSHHLFSSKLD